MRFLFTFCLFFLAFAAQAAELRAIALNIEAGWKPDAELATITAQMQRYPEIDLWALSEVTKGWESDLATAAANARGANFAPVLGSKTTDRLVLLINTDRFDVLGSPIELLDIWEEVGGRAPLFAWLRDKETGMQFAFMVNHLHRGNVPGRYQQAEFLNAWAARQNLALITGGDFNFDYNLPPEPAYRDRGYDAMIRNDTWVWVRPDSLIKTQCSEKYNSVLDFWFVAGPARNWARKAEILERAPAYCQDTPQTPDHRPVLLRILLE